MKEIEEGLYKIHAEARQKQAESSTEETPSPTSEDALSRLSPFLVIDKVDEGSPAHTCVNRALVLLQTPYGNCSSALLQGNMTQYGEI